VTRNQNKKRLKVETNEAAFKEAASGNIPYIEIRRYGIRTAKVSGGGL